MFFKISLIVLVTVLLTYSITSAIVNILFTITYTSEVDLLENTFTFANTNISGNNLEPFFISIAKFALILSISVSPKITHDGILFIKRILKV